MSAAKKKGPKWADGAGRSAKKPKACATCGRADGLHEIDCARRLVGGPGRKAPPKKRDVCADCGAGEKTHKQGCAWAATHRGHFENQWQAPFIVTSHVVEPMKETRVRAPEGCSSQPFGVFAAGVGHVTVVWVLKAGEPL